MVDRDRGVEVALHDGAVQQRRLVADARARTVPVAVAVSAKLLEMAMALFTPLTLTGVAVARFRCSVPLRLLGPRPIPAHRR